jgi:adenosine 3'-phospho 5'-phosphosulfate transporter B3
MESARELFGLSVVSWPRSLQFATAFLGIFLSFLLPSLFLEKLQVDFGLTPSCLYTLLQFLAATLMRLPQITRLMSSHHPLSAPFRLYLVLAFVLVSSMVLHNFAACHLSHSSELLFKAPKLIPVMVGNVVLLKRTLSPLTVITVCLVVTGFVGVAICNFAGPGEYSLAGITAVFASLTLEAVAASIEEHVLVTCRASQDEAMSVTFPIGATAALAKSILSGELRDAGRGIVRTWRAVPYLLVYAVMGAVGLHFVFFSIALFGCVQTVLFTSLRKIIIALGALFSRGVQAGMCYRFSLLTVAAGVSANVYAQITEQKGGDKGEGFLPDPLGEPGP